MCPLPGRKNLLSLLKALAGHETSRVITTPAKENALNCVDALLKRCGDDAWLPGELHTQLQMIQTILGCEEASATNLSNALTSLQGASGAERGGGGGLREFLHLHVVGRKLTAHAQTVCDTRNNEKEMQECIDDWVSGLGCREHSCVSAVAFQALRFSCVIRAPPFVFMCSDRTSCNASDLRVVAACMHCLQTGRCRNPTPEVETATQLASTMDLDRSFSLLELLDGAT